MVRKKASAEMSERLREVSEIIESLYELKEGAGKRDRKGKTSPPTPCSIRLRRGALNDGAKPRGRVYVFAYSTYDWYEPHILLHERVFDEQEFKKLCDAALAEAVECMLARADERECLRLNDAIEEAVKILVEKHGFRKPERLEIKYSGTLDTEYPKGITVVPPEGISTLPPGLSRGA